MTSAALQWIAVLAMAVDHVGYLLFPEIPLLRAFGRISFSHLFFFCWRRASATRRIEKNTRFCLAVFAVLSELPYELFLYGPERLGTLFPMKNILFSLLLAFGALWCAERGGGFFFGAALLALGAELGGFSYGAYGVALPLCFYFCSRAFLGEEKMKMPGGSGAVGSCASTACTVLYCAAHGSMFQIWAVFAAVPLFFYNGKRGGGCPGISSMCFIQPICCFWFCSMSWSCRKISALCCHQRAFAV